MFLLVIALVCVLYLFVLFIPTKRKKQIEEVLADLESLRGKIPPEQEYALNENIIFFKAIRSIFTYVYWIVFRAFTLNPDRLLEISDFGIEKWDKEVHLGLLRIERWKFPGVHNDLLNEIVPVLGSCSNNSLVVANMGSGIMELDRQLITTLRKKGFKKKLLILGIDKSPTARSLAQRNLKELCEGGIVKILANSNVSNGLLDELKKERGPQFIVILYDHNALTIGDVLMPHSIDLIYYSKFRHHLSDEQKVKADRTFTTLSKVVIENDNYRGYFLIIFSLVTSWGLPIFLNAAALSALRDPRRKELENLDIAPWKVKYFRGRGYIRIYRY